jgi:hypothetical protein
MPRISDSVSVAISILNKAIESILGSSFFERRSFNARRVVKNPATTKLMVTKAREITPVRFPLTAVHAITTFPVMEEVNNARSFRYPAASTKPPTKARMLMALASLK